MISKNLIDILKKDKNLLAFSAGVDSTALFFILLEKNINFDIAIVNYGLREQAEEEIEYAKELAKKYNKKIFIATAPKFNSNFEKQARDFRYSFFREIIKEYRYKNLLTAHQLNDKLEWLLMRLSKGAGVSELSGIKIVDNRKNYTLIRPLLNYTKDELIFYLESNKIKYFVDSSNFSTKYERNRFREISNLLIKTEGKKGFVKSFEILSKESKILEDNFKLILKEKKFLVIKLLNRSLISNAVSKYLKELGYLISGKERAELLKKDSIVVGRVWAVEFKDGYLYIAPYIKTAMPKEFKERCRVCKIPPKVRGYIYVEKIPLQGSC